MCRDEMQKGKYRRLKEESNERIFIALKSNKLRHQDNRGSSTVATWEEI